MEAERLVDTLSKSLLKLEGKTLIHTLTDMLNEVGVETLGCTLHTLSNGQREVDVKKLRNRGAGIV